MIANLSNLIETISNPNGRFHTLEGIYPVTDEEGMPVMKNTSMSIDFKMRYSGEEYVLKCLKSKSLRNKTLLKDISGFCTLVDSPHITAYDYREAEMTVYNDNGEPVYIDVIMQKIPDGILLSELLEKHSGNGDSIKLIDLLSHLSSLAIWMTDNDFSHGRISARNIHIGYDGIPVLINYERSCRQVPEDDVNRIAVLCCAIYLTACDPRFYRHLMGGSYTSMTQAMSDITDADSPGGFKNLIDILGNDNRDNTNIKDICKLICGLSECTPVKIKALSDMLDKIHPESEEVKPDISKYKFVGEPHDNLLRALDGEKWFYINRNGKVMIDNVFLEASDFFEGRAIVRIITGYGMIDHTGKFLIKPIFDDLELDPTGCFIIATKDGLSGIYARSGEQITELAFDQILTSSEGMFPVKKDKKLGFLDKVGNIAIPIKYDDVYKFKNGIANVFLNGRCYVIDKEGNIIDEAYELKK